MTQRGAHAVHRCIAAAQHDDVQPGSVDIRLLSRCRQPHHLFGVGNEERQRIVNAGGLFVRQPRLHGAIGSGADEHRVIVGQQRRHGDIFPHLAIELKADTHLAENGPPPGQQRFIQLERRDAEGQQTANLRMTVKNHRLDAVTHQHIGAGQPGRPGADNRHPLTARLNLREVRTPTAGQRLVGNIALNVADGDCAAFIAQGAGTFTQPVLGADATGDLRQAVGLMGKRDRGGDIPRLNQLDPLRDMVMQRAGPFANTVFPTREAAGGLLLRLRRGERLIDLLKVALTRLRRQLIRLPARRRHRHLPDLRANIGLAAGRRTALPRLHLLACRAQSPLLRQRGQRLIVGEGQCLRGTVFHTGRSRLAALAQIAFLRAGLYQARSLRRHHHLHHPERAGHHAGFTANAFLLTDLNAVAGLGNGVVGATADAGGVFTVAAGDSVTLARRFDDGDTR